MGLWFKCRHGYFCSCLLPFFPNCLFRGWLHFHTFWWQLCHLWFLCYDFCCWGLFLLGNGGGNGLLLYMGLLVVIFVAAAFFFFLYVHFSCPLFLLVSRSFVGFCISSFGPGRCLLACCCLFSIFFLVLLSQLLLLVEFGSGGSLVCGSIFF